VIPTGATKHAVFHKYTGDEGNEKTWRKLILGRFKGFRGESAQGARSVRIPGAVSLKLGKLQILGLYSPEAPQKKTGVRGTLYLSLGRRKGTVEVRNKNLSAKATPTLDLQEPNF